MKIELQKFAEKMPKTFKIKKSYLEIFDHDTSCYENIFDV